MNFRYLIKLILMLVSPIFAKSPEQVAKDFWVVYSRGDVAEMSKFYAKSIKLERGSELLKTSWGIAKKGDKSTGATLNLSDLIHGYKLMIEKFGQQKWASVFEAIPNENISYNLNKDEFNMKISVGKGNDYIEFRFKQENEKWLIFYEFTDL